MDPFWLCETLGAPLLVEDASGVHASEGARRRLGASSPADLSGAVRAYLGGGADVPAVEQAIRAARTGAHTEVALARGGRALVFAPAIGSVAVAFAPESSADAREAADAASHELANALGAIAGWARLARQGARVSEALELIEKSAESAWSTARRILGKDRQRHERALDLSAFVEESARFLSLKADERGVKVRLRIEPAVFVRGDRGHAWSIVWNLATNALEALSAGGTLELRVSRAPLHAVLEVIDDGPGMNAVVRARAFERRFTTKPTGSGLGLALVKEAAEQLGGNLTLDSEPERGTRVRVELPYASAPRHGRSRPSGVYYAGPLEGRILVVDDDDAVREMIATALRSRGAEVVATASASEALAESGRFHLAIVDLHLADLSGDELLAKLRAAGNVQHGMLVSGEEQPRLSAPGGQPDTVLRKPFDLDDLFALLPEEMRGGADASEAIRIV